MFLQTPDLGVTLNILAKDDDFFDMGCSSLNENDAVINGLMGLTMYTLDGGATFNYSKGFVGG